MNNRCIYCSTGSWRCFWRFVLTRSACCPTCGMRGGGLAHGVRF